MITIYHNPTCSKSRQTLALLEDKGLEIDIIEYLNHPPSKDTLDAICLALGMAPQALMRTAEPRFAALGLSVHDERTRDEWLTLLAENPILIERPIVVIDDRALIGRPPERVFELFSA